MHNYRPCDPLCHDPSRQKSFGAPLVLDWASKAATQRTSPPWPRGGGAHSDGKCYIVQNHLLRRPLHSKHLGGALYEHLHKLQSKLLHNRWDIVLSVVVPDCNNGALPADSLVVQIWNVTLAIVILPANHSTAITSKEHRVQIWSTIQLVGHQAKGFQASNLLLLSQPIVQPIFPCLRSLAKTNKLEQLSIEFSSWLLGRVVQNPWNSADNPFHTWILEFQTDNPN